jgi:predicted metalloprotease with PDZ domain
VSFGGVANVLGGVVDGGPAQQAGLQAGDTIVSVGDITVQPDKDWGPTFRSRYAGKTGPVPVVVRRDGQTMTLNVTPGQRTVTGVQLSRIANPTAKAAKVWLGIATGAVEK